MLLCIVDTSTTTNSWMHTGRVTKELWKKPKNANCRFFRQNDEFLRFGARPIPLKTGPKLAYGSAEWLGLGRSLIQTKKIPNLDYYKG